ncbi:hypothetical protein MRX96_037806 [Rhipicephalus microplus]
MDAFRMETFPSKASTSTACPNRVRQLNATKRCLVCQTSRLDKTLPLFEQTCSSVTSYVTVPVTVSAVLGWVAFFLQENSSYDSAKCVSFLFLLTQQLERTVAPSTSHSLDKHREMGEQYHRCPASEGFNYRRRSLLLLQPSFAVIERPLRCK